MIRTSVFILEIENEEEDKKIIGDKDSEKQFEKKTVLPKVSNFLSEMRCIAVIITAIKSPKNGRVSVDNLGECCPKCGSNYKEIHDS